MHPLDPGLIKMRPSPLIILPRGTQPMHYMGGYRVGLTRALVAHAYYNLIPPLIIGPAEFIFCEAEVLRNCRFDERFDILYLFIFLPPTEIVNCCFASAKKPTKQTIKYFSTFFSALDPLTFISLVKPSVKGSFYIFAFNSFLFGISFGS